MKHLKKYVGKLCSSYVYYTLFILIYLMEPYHQKSFRPSLYGVHTGAHNHYLFVLSIELSSCENASKVWLECNYGYKQSKEVRMVKNLDVLFYVLVSFIRCLLEMSKLIFETLVDLLVVALLLLHLLELRLDVLGQVVDGRPVLLDRVVLLLVLRLVVVQLVVDLIDLFTGFLVPLQGFILFGLDQVIDGCAGLRNMVHDVVGGVLDAGLRLVEVLVLLGKVVQLDRVQPLQLRVVLLEQGLVALHHILVVRLQKFKTF